MCTSDLVPHCVNLELERFPRLSTGIDSNVYKVGSRVAKEYQSLSFQKVAEYVALQNEAAPLPPSAIPSGSQDQGGRLRAFCRPSHIGGGARRLGVRKASGFRPVRRSPNLEKLLWRPDMFAKYADSQLCDPMLREFGFNMNEFFWNEYPTRAQDELYYHVCMLSRLLDHILGVSGCYISKYNVKLQPVPGEPRIELVITDLALYIERVAGSVRGD